MSKTNRVLIIFILFFILFINISFIPKISPINYINEDIDAPKYSTGLEGADNVLITRIYRVVNISGYGLIRFEDTLTVKNLNNNPLTSILIGIPLYLSDELVYYNAIINDQSTILAERSNMILNNYEMITIYFNSPLLPQESKTIKFIQQYKEFLTYIPLDASTNSISYFGFVYPILPYKAEGDIESIFLLPDGAFDLEGGWGFENSEFLFIRYQYDYIKLEIGDDFISPFLENLGDKKIVDVSFANRDFTKMEIIELNRDIFISPWGIIRVNDDILIQNLGVIEHSTIEIVLPRAAKSIYVSDDLGEISKVILYKRTTEIRLTIDLFWHIESNRIKLFPNTSFRFNLEYYLPFENYFSANWLQESIQIDLLITQFDYLIREQTVRLIIDGCYAINSITETPISIENTKGTTILMYNSEFITPEDSKIIQFTFTIDIFNMMLRPIVFTIIISLIASLFVLIVKLTKKEQDGDVLTRDLIPFNEIREYYSLYEEKNALILEIRQSEEDAKRKKMAKKLYKNILNKNTLKIEEIQKEILPFKRALIETGETFENIVKKLDVLEAERISIKDSLNLLESRYKRGRLPSRAAYLKLSDDFKKRERKIDRTIDKLLQQLRSYLL
ncbi:MAG: hypothetical protein JSV62_02705 [Promethearchaeota archaeon]|nr:MAG: hypothetical protein JSV62_02705 [Candidatus Lokiarchaeota archaeon]